MSDRLTRKSDPMAEGVFRPLPVTFRSRGWDFARIARTGDVALFEKRHPDVKAPSFELVIVQRYGERMMGGKVIEPAEAMPPTSAWGRLGWTLRTEREAFEQFDKLAKERTPR